MTELRNQYKWPLFFSMQKLLLLYHLLEEENPNLEAIVHEISFLFSNTQEAWESALKMVKVSGHDQWIRGGSQRGKREEGRGKGESRGVMYCMTDFQLVFCSVFGS